MGISGQGKAGKNKFGASDSHKNDDLMNFLEHKLEDVENKLKRQEQEYQLLQQDYQEQ